MYLDTYRFNIDPSGGTLDEKIEGIDGTYDSYFISNSDFDTEVISGYELVTSPGLRLKVYFNPNSGTVAKSGGVMFEVTMAKYRYDEELDPNHENPILIDEAVDELRFEYIQSIHVDEIEVPSYNPDPEDPDSCTAPPDSEITDAQSNLNEGGILNQDTITVLKKSLLVENNNLFVENEKVKASAMADLHKINKLEEKLAKYRTDYDEEYHKKNPNKSKLDNINEKYHDTEEKINDLKKSLNSVIHNTNPDVNYELAINAFFSVDNPDTIPYSQYINERYEKLSSSTVGMETDNEFLKFNRNFSYLQQFVPKIIECISTASLEPMTAIVVTPTGAGSVAGNPLQVMGTVKRISGQVLNLYPVILDLLNQCRILKLPKNIFDVVDSISKKIKPLASLVNSLGF